MNYPRYPAYKASGVAWLGEVPSHWDVKRIKWLFKRYKVVNRPQAELLSVYRDYGVVRKSDRDDNFNKPSEDLSAYQYVEIGDLVLNKMKTWQGSIAVSNLSGIVSPAYYVAKPLKSGFDNKYIHFLLRSPKYIGQYLRFSDGIRPNQWDLSFDNFKLIDVLLPPLPEQCAIAAFLDRETARIDTLIARQETLIALLQEKRKAVISHAVTKGLDPAAPMKDSGVAWLGEVPAHWKVGVKLSTLAQKERNSFVNGPFGSDLLTSELREIGIPVIYIRDISSAKYLRISGAHVTEEKAQELNAFRVDTGDVLISKVGDPPGIAALYPMAEPVGIVTQDVIRIKIDRRCVIPEYLVYLLNSRYLRVLVDLISVDSTRTRISLGEFKQIRIILPDLSEQAGICHFLDKQTAQIDALIAKAEQCIELLREHRTSLIAAAVTGKIDVRGMGDEAEGVA